MTAGSNNLPVVFGHKIGVRVGLQKMAVVGYLVFAERVGYVFAEQTQQGVGISKFVRSYCHGLASFVNRHSYGQSGKNAAHEPLLYSNEGWPSLEPTRNAGR